MSTFLVSFGVVAATIAAVVYLVLNGPDQPATIRRPTSRAKAGGEGREPGGRRARRKAAQVRAAEAAPAAPRPAVRLPSGPAMALSDSDVMRLRVLPANRTTLWVRIRSAVALVVLVAVLGALLALAIGAVALGLALVVRSATG